MKNLIYSFLSLLIVLSSCEKFDEVHQEYVEGGEIVYSVKPDSIEVIPGYKRCMIKAQVVVTSNVDKFVVEWGEQTVETPIPSDDTASVEVEINSITEGAVIFNVITVNKMGDKSVPSNAYGNVYGEKYQKTLLPRIIDEVKGVDGGAVVMFSSSPDKSVGIRLNYKDQDGVIQTISVSPDVNEVNLPNSMFGSELDYLTYYLPEENCLDTIPTYSPTYELIPEPVLVEKIVEVDASSIMELDNDVKDPVWGSKYSNLFDGKFSTYTAFDFSEERSSLSFDLRKILKLSKVKVWFRLNTDEHYFGGSNAKTIEIYGADELPASSDFSDWDLLGTYTFQKPSAGEELTDEDKTIAEDGLECLIEGNINARYLRIKVLENFNGSANFYFGNIEFYALQY